MTGVPAETVPRPMASTSNRSAWQQPAMVTAASRGITPTRASAAASAASKSSMACSQARSETVARMASVEKVGPKRPPSGGKKGRLSVALHVDVEDEHATLVPSHQGGPHVGVGDGREHRIGRVGDFLVREVDARHEVLEQAAREHQDLDVRSLEPPVRVRNLAGLDGQEAELTLGPGRTAGEAPKATLFTVGPG